MNILFIFMIKFHSFFYYGINRLRLEFALLKYAGIIRPAGDLSFAYQNLQLTTLLYLN